MRVLSTVLALLCVAAGVALADYMYRPPPHLMPHLGHHHGPPHKHHPFVSGKAPGGGPGKHSPSRPPPPPHYHGRPHHRPRKPPPPPLSATSPWKTTPYKTTKDPFRTHGAEADFGSQAAVLSAIKSSPLSSVAGGSLLGGSAALSVHSTPRPSLAVPGGLHAYTNVISDDHGPIHTIPAPNLGPADKPSHLSESSSYAASLEQQALQRQAIHSALSQLQAVNAARPVGPTPTPAALQALQLHHTQGYQVSEAPTASQEGVPQLYAPDPDPSRPAPRLQPTTDPHSLPSEGRGPHFSVDPQFGAVSSQPGYAAASHGVGPTLFHLLNGFPLQGHGLQGHGLQALHQDIGQPHVQIMHHGLSGDSLAADPQHLLLQPQQQQLHHLQHQHLQQQLQAQAAHHLHHLQPADFQPQYQSFDFDEQSYQKGLFQPDQDHEGSEDAPRPSVQRPYSPAAQEPSPSASTVSLFTVPPPPPTASTRGDVRAEDDAEDDADAEDEYDDAVPSRLGGSSTTLALGAVTPAPQQDASAPSGPEDEGLQQSVIREDADSYAEDPSLVTPFRRQPNSVHVPDPKQQREQRLPYGTRIRPKRIAIE